MVTLPEAKICVFVTAFVQAVTITISIIPIKNSAIWLNLRLFFYLKFDLFVLQTKNAPTQKIDTFLFEYLYSSVFKEKSQGRFFILFSHAHPAIVSPPPRSDYPSSGLCLCRLWGKHRCRGLNQGFAIP